MTQLHFTNITWSMDKTA